MRGLTASSKRRTLYRGTRLPWPVNVFNGNVGLMPKDVCVEPLTTSDAEYLIAHRAPLKLTHLISCTEEEAIAEEFAGKTGYVHVIRVLEGLPVIDVNRLLCGGNNLSPREKEIVVLPGKRATVSVFLHPVRIDRTQRRIWWKLVTTVHGG